MPEVIVVGAGPTGLMLALELGRRGIATLVLSDNRTTSATPKATVTQARTMEQFRRVGLAGAVRATGIPADLPTDAVYTTRIARHELARHRMPSPDEARRRVRDAASVTPELTHRSSQMWIEPLLVAACRRVPAIDLRLGWRVTRFHDTGDAVTVDAEHDGRPHAFTAAYLVGCDGAASTIRAQLGIDLGDSAAITAFKGRPMFSVHARAPRMFERLGLPRGWLFAAINPAQRGSCIVLSDTEIKLNFWRPAAWTGDTVTRDQIAEIQHAMFGRAIDFDVIGTKSWRGGASRVAGAYRRGRVLLAGDAAHLFTPSAGLGYCTGIDDAVNLGWKLAALVRGWGGAALLDAYERECRPEALRRTRFAADCAERLAVFQPSAEIDRDTLAGAQERARAAAYFATHLPRQYDIPGINFGARFDDSPIIAGDHAPPPPGDANHYTPSGKPGGRAPHAWLPDGRALYDALGPGFTLLVLDPRARDEAARLHRAATARGIPLVVYPVPAHPATALRDRYEADLALIRPDHVIAWRGAIADDAVLARITGTVPR